MISEILSLLKTEQGRACTGTPQGTSQFVLLNVSYHKEHEYTWFRVGI